MILEWLGCSMILECHLPSDSNQYFKQFIEFSHLTFIQTFGGSWQSRA